MEEISEKEIFETMPVYKAVAALAVPTIISQIVSIIYNLADIFFIGQMGNPYMVAAATYQRILDGIKLVKQEQIDAVIEIGGASAMDTGKAIAFGAVHEGLEDYVEGKKNSDNCIFCRLYSKGCTSCFLSGGPVIEEGCAMLRVVMKKSDIQPTLSAYGTCPSKEYILRALDPEDFGEFTQDEMCQMVEACYL